MPIPSTVADLSATAALNSPTGSESPTQGDDFIRAHASIIRQNYDAAAASGGSALVGFIQAGTGALLQTMQAKNREYVSAVGDFGCVGDDATNNNTALTNFINSAIANPGIPHRITPGIYRITAALPTINVSNVMLECPGAGLHDVTTIFNGAVIKWTGAAGATMLTIAPTSGASNQRLCNLRMRGIAFDCNSLAAYGLKINSVWESELEYGVANATSYGAFYDVVASLGEARDVQKNRIRHLGRQVEAPGGISFGATGDTAANFSMNELWCDIQHKDITAILLANSDNNDWRYVRTFCVGGGAATECMNFQGGATVGQTVRAERVHFLSANKPAHAYGTGTFTFPSVNNKIYCLDVENGSPAPVIDTGATLYWQKDSTPLPDTAWVAWTPTISASSGTITTASAVGRYLNRGKIIYLRVEILITTNGTGAGNLQFTLPAGFASNGSIGSLFYGQERAVTGNAITGYIDGGGATVVNLKKYDGSYPGGNGYVICVEGFYDPV